MADSTTPTPPAGQGRGLGMPPHNPASEMAVLGGILRVAHDDTVRAANLLEQAPMPDEYYHHSHEKLAGHLRAAANNGGALDPGAILTRVMDAGDLRENTLDGPYIQRLIEVGCPASSISWHADVIRRLARRRRQIENVRRALQRLTDSDPDDDSVVYEAMADLEELSREKTEKRDFEYVAFDGLFSRPRQPVNWLARPLIAAGRVTLLYSPGKVGKSLIAMECGAALTTGRDVLDSQPTGELTHVLYIDQEMTEEDWQDRLADMGYGTADESLLAEYLHLAQLQAWPPMDTPEGGKAVLAEAEYTAARVVIIDTASKVFVGEENSNDTQQAFYRNTVIPLKRAGIAVLILDHTGKDIERGARGASAKTDNVDLAFELLPRAQDHLAMRCTHARFRDDAVSEPTFLHRASKPLRHEIEERPVMNTTHGPGLRPTHLMEKVSRYVELNPNATRKVIETSKLGKTDYVRMAIDILVTEGYLHCEKGPHGGQQHQSLMPYREDEDE